MAWLRLLNLLFFGPKVTASKKNYTETEGREFALLGAELRALLATTRFGRSLRILTVSGGSSNAEESELRALTNAYYDIDRFGLSFVASPRHADILFVTGPVTRNFAGVLKAVYAAVPQPCLVVAIGDGACTGGIWKDSYAVVGPVAAVIPVNLCIPGDPPNPTQILRELLGALRST
ncbi:MAG: formate hydrogenlyase [Patescibacteria group bacterium]